MYGAFFAFRSAASGMGKSHGFLQVLLYPNRWGNAKGVNEKELVQSNPPFLLSTSTLKVRQQNRNTARIQSHEFLFASSVGCITSYLIEATLPRAEVQNFHWKSRLYMQSAEVVLCKWMMASNLRFFFLSFTLIGRFLFLAVLLLEIRHICLCWSFSLFFYE